jgi:hypothetical protein
MWESLGYCTIVVVFECVGMIGYVIFDLRHWLLLGACMFILELSRVVANKLRPFSAQDRTGPSR